MLFLLLDEQISPVIADQIRAKRPEIPIDSVCRWRAGSYAGVKDAPLLAAAAEDEWTLVTYDLQTIPPLLVKWGIQGRSHGGTILIDNRTIASSDFGRLTTALIRLWDEQNEFDWKDRVSYLRP